MTAASTQPPAPDKATIERVVGEVVSGDARVLAVYWFGSRARGEELEGSDVDLAVLFSEPVDVMDLLAFEDRIERALGVPVDLIDLGKANAFLEEPVGFHPGTCPRLPEAVASENLHGWRCRLSWNRDSVGCDRREEFCEATSRHSARED